MSLANGRGGALLLAAVLLQSCGGGGGGDGGGGGNPPPPGGNSRILITDGNALVVGQLSFGPASDGLLVMQLLTVAASDLHQQLLVPQSLLCENDGVIEFRGFDDDRNARLSAGDRVQVSYFSCGGVDGTLTLEITQVATDDNVITSLEGSMTIALELFGGTLSGGGTMDFRATASELRWLGTAVAVAFSDGLQDDALTGGRIEKTVVSGNDGLEYSLTLSGTVESEALGGEFEFRTATTFSGLEGEWPQSGVLVAEGRSNSEVRFQPGSFDGVVAYRVDSGASTEIGWAEVTSGFLFGVDDGAGGPPPSPPTTDALGRKLKLGGAGEDLQVDHARGRIYVTVPDRNELLVISAQTLAVLDRILLGSQPSGMSLSLDGEELFVGLGGSGSIAIVDLDTLASSEILVAPALDTSIVYDVVETSPGILFVSSGDTHGTGIRIDRSTGVQTAVAAMDRTVSHKVELLADPPRNVLYVGDGWGVFPQNMKKLDAADPLAPQIIASDHGSIGGTHRMSLDPTGTRVYLQSGQVLSTSDFSEIGTITSGPSWAVDNGVDVMVAEGPGTLVIHSAQNLVEVDRLTSDCDFGQVERIAPSAVNGQWLMLGDARLCVIDILNPGQRPGTGDPGELADPAPQRNVPVVDLDLGSAAFDAEFDTGRNRLYVSLPDAGEVVTIDAADQEILDRDDLGNGPRGLDLSPDGGTLAVIFRDNGHIGFKDLASGITETRDLTSFLLVPGGNDVAYMSDTAIFATASGSTIGRVVRTNRLNAADTQVVANDRNMNDRVELAPSPDGRFLYVSDRLSLMYQLDLTQPEAPILAEAEPIVASEILGADRMSVSPDGNRIANRFGQILRTSDFTYAGQVTRGIPLYAEGGAEILVAHQTEPGRIDRVDAASFVTSEEIHGNCSIGTPWRLVANATEDMLMTVGDSRACFWFLGQQGAQSAKIGPQSAYACEAGCLMRKHRRQSWGLLQSRPFERRR